MKIFSKYPSLTKWLGEKINVIKNICYEKEQQASEVDSNEFESTCIVIQFGPGKEIFRISMKKLTENFLYFNNKSTLCSLNKKRKCEHFLHISLQSFEVLLKLATEGKY